MFCASWLLGPAAGPKGVSIFSAKMGSAPPSWRTILRMPKMLLRSACSVRIQSISCSNGIGLMMSLIVSSSPAPPRPRDGASVDAAPPVVRDGPAEAVCRLWGSPAPGRFAAPAH